MEIIQRAQKVKLIIFDIDGVLTDGKIVISTEGEIFKSFSACDGLGITLAHKVGIQTAIITGRASKIVEKRCLELKIKDVYQGVSNKAGMLQTILEKHNLKKEQVCFIGDDLNDLLIMQQVGFACTVFNAAAEIKAVAHYMSAAGGGNGAVREIIEYILKAQQLWEKSITAYLEYCGSAEVGQ